LLAQLGGGNGVKTWRPFATAFSLKNCESTRDSFWAPAEMSPAITPVADRNKVPQKNAGEPRQGIAGIQPFQPINPKTNVQPMKLQ
jgi:hypothetical protein